jgi:hypothetical protein
LLQEDFEMRLTTLVLILATLIPGRLLFAETMIGDNDLDRILGRLEVKDFDAIKDPFKKLVSSRKDISSLKQAANTANPVISTKSINKEAKDLYTGAIASLISYAGDMVTSYDKLALSNKEKPSDEDIENIKKYVADLKKDVTGLRIVQDIISGSGISELEAVATKLGELKLSKLPYSALDEDDIISKLEKTPLKLKEAIKDVDADKAYTQLREAAFAKSMVTIKGKDKFAGSILEVLKEEAVAQNDLKDADKTARVKEKLAKTRRFLVALNMMSENRPEIIGLEDAVKKLNAAYASLFPGMGKTGKAEPAVVASTDYSRLSEKARNEGLRHLVEYNGVLTEDDRRIVGPDLEKMRTAISSGSASKGAPVTAPASIPAKDENKDQILSVLKTCIQYHGSKVQYPKGTNETLTKFLALPNNDELLIEALAMLLNEKAKDKQLDLGDENKIKALAVLIDAFYIITPRITENKAYFPSFATSIGNSKPVDVQLFGDKLTEEEKQNYTDGSGKKNAVSAATDLMNMDQDKAEQAKKMEALAAFLSDAEIHKLLDNYKGFKTGLLNKLREEQKQRNNTSRQPKDTAQESTKAPADGKPSARVNYADDKQLLNDYTKIMEAYKKRAAGGKPEAKSEPKPAAKVASR